MRYLKTIILLWVAILACLNANAQSANPAVISTAGTTLSIPGGYKYTFTVGEVAIQTIGSNPTLTQGFNQSLLSFAITNVSATNQDAAYKAGAVLEITLSFNQQVYVTGKPELALNSAGKAIYASGSGSNTLIFSYTVADGENAPDLDYTSINALTLPASSTIKNSMNAIAPLTLPTPGSAGSLGTNKNLIIDGIAPNPPAALALDPASDSGSSNSDGFTNLNTPVITGTAEDGSTVTLYDTDEVTIIGTGIATGGVWSIRTSILSDDTHSITARARDLAENVSALSNSIIVTVNTARPTVSITSSVPGLKAAETATITFAFSEDPGNSFTWDGSVGDIVVTGGTLSAISGTGLIHSATFTPTTGVNSGTASITIPAGSFNDIYGNAGTAGTKPALTFDTSVPEAPTSIKLAAASDSGPSNTDRITNLTSLLFNGAAEVNSTVTLYGGTDGTTVIGTGPAIEGIWQITSNTLSPGVHIVSAKTTDVAGNISVASESISVTIITAAPTINSIARVDANPSNATGVSFKVTFSKKVYNLNSSNFSLVQSGTATGIKGSISTTDNMVYFVGLSSVTGDGQIGLNFLATGAVDIAGNAVTTDFTGEKYTFDHTSPTLSAVRIVSNNINPFNGLMNQVIAKVGNTATLSFTSNETIATPTVSIAGHTIIPTANLNNWSATYTFSATDTEGLVPFQISFKDASGNPGLSVSSGSGTVTFDKTVPAAPSGILLTAGNQQIKVNYTANTETDVAYYQLYTGTDPAQMSLIAMLEGHLSYMQTGLVNGKTYYYQMTAIDKAGNISALSDIVSAIPTQNQSITFNGIDQKIYGDLPFSLGSLNSSANLPVTYTADDPAIVSISGNSATILKAGTTIIRASQPGNAAFNPAPIVQQTLSVNPKMLTITATNRSKTYGDASVFNGTEFTAPGLITGDAITSVTLNSSGAAATANVAGSAYNILPSAALGSGLSNYNLVYANGKLTINKKDLIITADPQVKYFGAVIPTMTVSYNGFVNGESKSVLSSLPTTSTSANEASPVGEYDIIASAATADNYSFTYRTGTLTIKPDMPTSLSLANVTLYENQAAGANAGTLSSTSENPNATFTYALVNGAGATDNNLFSINGNKLFSATALDFESKSVYKIRVRTSTQNNNSLEKELTINLTDVNEAPTLSAIADQILCVTSATQRLNLAGISAGPESGQRTTLSVSNNNPALFDNLSISGSGATATLSYTLKNAAFGLSTVTVKVQDDGGTDNGGIDTYTLSFLVRVNGLPTLAIRSDNGNQVSKGATVTLTASGGTNYVWANSQGVLSDLNVASIKVRPSQTTTYTVTSTNVSGCSVSQTFTLSVLNDLALIKATNILSPNGDGYNDKWVIDNIDFYPNNEVKVFDKGGRILFQKKSYDNSWDAMINGSPLEEGTYYYIIDFGTNTPKFRGFITVIREN
ncbi:Ig-like domain-containing protein [Pedobacter gandavensis]|uniref:Ig-like domain-containing protein n=1 Tax=Pedobacter gandavensis TaxID=2679963 RepID=UPI00292FC97C|nr:Ig-like domain-containing protein [Pedobacter gandavensis]